MRPCLTLHTKAALEFKHREQVPAFFFFWAKFGQKEMKILKVKLFKKRF